MNAHYFGRTFFYVFVALVGIPAYRQAPEGVSMVDSLPSDEPYNLSRRLRIGRIEMRAGNGFGNFDTLTGAKNASGPFFAPPGGAFGAEVSRASLTNHWTTTRVFPYYHAKIMTGQPSIGILLISTTEREEAWP